MKRRAQHVLGKKRRRRTVREQDERMMAAYREMVERIQNAPPRPSKARPARHDPK